MTTTTMSIGKLTRNGNILDQYDYIDTEDIKSHDYKGVFVSEKYADEVNKFLRKIKEQEWLEENREAIEAQNRRIEKHGSFSDGIRRF